MRKSILNSVLVIALLGWAREARADIWDPNDDLPSCDTLSTPYFTSPPVDLSKVLGIEPPGFFNGDTHIIPIHVMYFYSDFTVVGGVPTPVLTSQNQPIYAPGNVLITGIEWDLKNGSDDWYVTFTPCREVRFRYHHLSVVGETGSALRARAEEIKAGTTSGDLETWCVGDPAVMCSGLVNIAATPTSGELGRVFWAGNPAFNLSMRDNRTSSTPPVLAGMPYSFDRYNLDYSELSTVIPAPTMPSAILFNEINPSRTAASDRQVRCATDYFDSTSKGSMEALFGNSDHSISWPSPANYPCGRFLHDDPGKIKGSWFADTEITEFIPDESKAAALTFDSLAQGTPVITIGRDLLPTGTTKLMVTFPGASTGTVNRFFQQTAFVTGGSQPIYCYDQLRPFDFGVPYSSSPGSTSGVVIFQLQSTDAEMKLEYLPSVTDCSSAPTFTSAAHTVIR